MDRPGDIPPGGRPGNPVVSSYESRFRKLFDSDLMGIGIPNRFGAFIEANDALLRMTGYTRADLEAGRVRWDVMTPPEYAELDREHIAEAARRGNCTPYEKEYIRKDGVRVPILCGYALLEGSEDEYIGFVQDLTQQKRAEAALRQSEEQFRALAESLPECIWASDPLGDATYCNRNYLEYTGVESLEAMTSIWPNLIHPEERESTLKLWHHALRTGEGYTSEYRLRRHDGAYRYHLARAEPVRDDHGKIKLWIGSILDIHDRKLSEDLLRRTEKLAAAGRLAASVAHEINNPLTSVTNALYLALQDDGLSATTRHYLLLAEQELARAAQVTTHTLRFHKQSVAPAEANVAELMNSALALYSRRFDAFSIAVEREYRAPATFHCCGDELRQAFAHLLSNALDAMPQGGRLRVRVRPSHHANTGVPGIRVTVADTGHGIPADLLPRVFEAFTSTKDATGTGLGLWVVEGIVRKHDGRIAVRSSTLPLRRGTVVSAFFPQTSALR